METLKACALIGLHLVTAEGDFLIVWCLCARAGRIPGLNGPRYPVWKEEDVSCSGNESTLVYEVYEHNNESRAVEVIGQDWSCEVGALFLEDWELERVALSCHMTMDLLCQGMRDVCWDNSESLGSRCSLCSQCWEDSLAEECDGREPGKSTVTVSESSLSLWTGCDRKGVGCGERK